MHLCASHCSPHHNHNMMHDNYFFKVSAVCYFLGVRQCHCTSTVARIISNYCHPLIVSYLLQFRFDI